MRAAAVDVGTTMLAWTPFLQPAPAVDRWWWLLIIPLAVGVSFAYKATRTADIARLPREALRMSALIVSAMVGLALFTHAVVIWLLPYLSAE
jgi:hypothetical protein